MRTMRKKQRRGLSLIEIMITTIVVVIAVIGTMGYRYYSVLDAKKADVQMTASSLGLLLLESWKGGGASTTYNPETSLSSQFSTFAGSASGPATPPGFTALPTACYHIVANNNVHYYANLSYMPAAGTVPMILNLSIAWKQDYKAGVVSASDKTIALTAYSNF